MANIDGVNNSPLQDLNINNKSTSEKKELGQEDFLALLVAQMRHQNPLEPQSNGEFLSQLAQFGTVDGVKNMQSSLDNLAASLQSNQALQASSLVGRSVFVPGSTADFDGNSGHWAVDLPSSVSDLNVGIYNQGGELVRQLNIGVASQGLTQIDWDGLKGDGQKADSGQYTIRAQGTVNGEQTSFSTLIGANVDSVSLGSQGEGLKLNVSGIGAVSLEDVRQIGS